MMYEIIANKVDNIQQIKDTKTGIYEIIIIIRRIMIKQKNCMMLKLIPY